MSPQKIYKLVMQGRLVPIIEKKDGKEMLIGYRRKSSSRKSNQAIQLREPQEIADLTPGATGLSVPMPKPIDLTT